MSGSGVVNGWGVQVGCDYLSPNSAASAGEFVIEQAVPDSFAAMFASKFSNSEVVLPSVSSGVPAGFSLVKVKINRNGNSDQALDFTKFNGAVAGKEGKVKTIDCDSGTYEQFVMLSGMESHVNASDTVYRVCLLGAVNWYGENLPSSRSRLGYDYIYGNESGETKIRYNMYRKREHFVATALGNFDGTSSGYTHDRLEGNLSIDGCSSYYDPTESYDDHDNAEADVHGQAISVALFQYCTSS